jgi:hypothetical protein
MRKVTQTAIGKVGAWVSFGRLFVSREKIAAVNDDMTRRKWRRSTLGRPFLTALSGSLFGSG